jgi:uncharacterized protein with beta-barrel porin domain
MKRLWGGLCAGTAAVAILAGTGAKAQTFTVTSGSTQTVTTPIGANQTVTVTGGGTLALTNAANAYKGGTVVIDGSTVSVSTDGELGGLRGAVTLGDASTPGTLQLKNTLVASAARAITLDGGGGIINASGTSLWTFSGVVSGAGPLTVDGTGSIALIGTNTYSGGVAIAGGATLRVTADTGLGAAAGAITLGDSSTAGTLSLGNRAGVTSARNVTLGTGGGTIETDTLPSTFGGWTFTGIVSGSGPLTVEGDQTLILDGINTETGAVTLSHGGLQVGDKKTTTASLAGDVVVSGGTLSGHGTIFGSLTNSGGIVAPGGGGIGPLTVEKSFSQGSAGTLTVELSPNGVSELEVNGAATLGGTLRLEFAPGSYKSGVYQLMSASSIAGNFASIAGNIGVGFSQDVSIGSTVVDLTVAKMTVLPESPTLYPAITSVVVDEAQQANTTLVSRLTEARGQALVDGLRIGEYPEHLDGTAPGSSAYGAWARGFGAFGSTSGSGQAPDFDVRGGGVIAGIDEALNSGSGAAGFAVSYNISDISEHGGASATVNTPRVGFYGGYWLGRLALDAALDFGLPRVDGTRPLPGSGQAKSSFTGAEFATALQAGLPIRRGELVVTPAIGMNYAFVSQGAFAESGSVLDIDGHKTNTNSLQPFISATFLRRIETPSGISIEPSLRASYAFEALSTSRNLVFQPPNDSTVFTADGVPESRSTFAVAGSVNVEVSRALAFGLDAGWTHNGNSNDETFDASVRYRF